MVVGSFIALGIMFFLMLPIITSRLAKRMGKDPRKWFLIGIILPVISTIILFFLPEENKE
jgi:Na+/melibiose symporter-like transporter